MLILTNVVLLCSMKPTKDDYVLMCYSGSLKKWLQGIETLSLLLLLPSSTLIIFPTSLGLKKVRKVRSHLFKTLKTLKIRLTSCGPDCDIVRETIRADHFHNVARLKGVGEYVNCRKGMSCHMHPTSALYGLRDMPDYVVNHELIPTTKEYLQCVTSVEP
ncbi:putative RNA helicase [Helianthus debilis subsp. tardiflorus]